MAEVNSELAVLRANAKALWMAGDYAKWSITLAPGAQTFVDRLHIQPNMRVLDVACGDGNAAIPAARAGAMVTGIDIATSSLEAGRMRAAQMGVVVQFDEGDAEQLPYARDAFDLVISFFGGVFTPRPEVAAAEFIRVCKPGGRIVLTSWSSEGFMGQMFKLIGQYSSPPPASPPVGPVNNSAPTLSWTDEAQLREHLRRRVIGVHISPQVCPFVYPYGVPEVVALFRHYNGPITKAFERLAPPMQMALQREMEALFAQHNIAGDSATHINAAYLEINIKR